MNDIVVECITRLLNSMVPVSEDTSSCYCQPLEVMHGKQFFSKKDLSVYGFKEVCLKKNKKAMSYLTKFFQGDLAEDKTVKNLEIDAESIHFDFNLVSALNF